jgi:outer membrane receptor protein involved in Fe transport
LTQEYDLTLSLNGVYRAAEKMSLAPVLGSTTIQQSSSYEVMNLSAAVNHKSWRYTAYVTNLLNKQEILVPPPQAAAGQNFDKLADDYLVNPPRVIGIRVRYTF